MTHLLSKRGFTLIELLIVVAIIGILAAIAVPNFLNAQMRAKVARVDADFNALTTAFEMYRLDYNDIPRWGANWGQTWGCFTTPTAYMSVIPIDVFQPEHQDQFVNEHHWYEFCGCNNRIPMKNFSDGQKVTDYVLASLGPDRDDDTINISDYPNTGIFMQYDSTNGLMSNGDYLKESKKGHNPMR